MILRCLKNAAISHKVTNLWVFAAHKADKKGKKSKKIISCVVGYLVLEPLLS